MKKLLLILGVLGLQSAFASQVSDTIISSAAQGVITAGTVTYLQSGNIQPQIIALPNYVGYGIYMTAKEPATQSYSSQNNHSAKQDFLNQYQSNNQ